MSTKLKMKYGHLLKRMQCMHCYEFRQVTIVLCTACFLYKSELMHLSVDNSESPEHVQIQVL